MRDALMTSKPLLLSAALAACSAVGPAFEPLPDVTPLRVEYRAEVIAGAWSPEQASSADATFEVVDPVLTEQVMIECRVLALADELVDAWSRDPRPVFALEIPSGAAAPLYDLRGVRQLAAQRVVVPSGGRGVVSVHDPQAFVESLRVAIDGNGLRADPFVAVAHEGVRVDVCATAVDEQVELEVVGDFAALRGLDETRGVGFLHHEPVAIQQPATFAQHVEVAATLAVYREVVVRLPGKALGQSLLLIVEPRIISE